MMRGQGQRPAGLTAMIAVLWVVTALNLLFWILFFATEQMQASNDPVYLSFERAFPAADVWLAITCVLCAEGLRRRRAWAVWNGIAAGSAFIYLGLMDTLYNLEHGMYFHWSGAMLAEGAINVICFLLGPLLMSYVWCHRQWLGV